MTSNSTQPTITIPKSQFDFLNTQLDTLRSENKNLMDNVYQLKKENGQMISKIDDVVNIQKTVKQLSKKVLEYSKCKVQLEKIGKPQSQSKEQVTNLQFLITELKARCEQQKKEYEQKCKELLTLAQGKSKLQLVSAQAVDNLKRRIAALESDNKNLEHRYKKMKEQNQELSNQNESIQGKYHAILEEFNDLYQKSNR